MARRCYQNIKNRGSNRCLTIVPELENPGPPALLIQKCPQCGNEGEIFSHELQVPHGDGGYITYTDILSYAHMDAKRVYGRGAVPETHGMKEG